eukprot:14541-Heterococcus_DN1.PRE.3
MTCKGYNTPADRPPPTACWSDVQIKQVEQLRALPMRRSKRLVPRAEQQRDFKLSDFPRRLLLLSAAIKRPGFQECWAIRSLYASKSNVAAPKCERYQVHNGHMQGDSPKRFSLPPQQILAAATTGNVLAILVCSSLAAACIQRAALLGVF